MLASSPRLVGGVEVGGDALEVRESSSLPAGAVTRERREAVDEGEVVRSAMLGACGGCRAEVVEVVEGQAREVMRGGDPPVEPGCRHAPEHFDAVARRGKQRRPQGPGLFVCTMHRELGVSVPCSDIPSARRKLWSSLGVDVVK